MGKRPRKKTPQNIVVGIIRKHPRGFGFVSPEDPSKHPEDIFIPKHLFKNAVDGDRVEVSVSAKSKKGFEGEILSVLDRGRKKVLGILTTIQKKLAYACVPILGENQFVHVKKETNFPYQIGDRLLLTIKEWGDDKHLFVCQVEKKIGAITDASSDIKAAIEEHELPKSFPKNVLQEAKQFGTSVSKNDVKNRLDLTETPCITIDPETAKDFDDALSIHKTSKGHFFLGVHIADVAHYVRVGSSLDQEAFRRANSTYLPGTCIPMLPEQLSNQLCSLRPDVIRLTISVLMEFDPKGGLIESKIHRSFIKSHKRFTYEEAKLVLEKKKKSPHSSSLQAMEELCNLLKKKRAERGSIDFALPELILILDKEGNPTGVKIEPYHITHQLVEEFMLKANEVVAKYLEDKKKSLLFRIHEEPDGENLEAFLASARALGFSIPPSPSQKDLQVLFQQAHKTPYLHQLSVGFIRNLKLAFYSPHNVGHYGLALEHYCHFTSPIRRYSDLIIHRLLFNEESKNLDLEKISKHCSERERISFRAEMSVKLLKKLRLLEIWKTKKPDHLYSGYINRIKPFGIGFEIKELFLEGFLHVSDLKRDYFIFYPEIPVLQGEHTGFQYRIGQEIHVKPTHIDFIHLETKWELSK